MNLKVCGITQLKQLKQLDGLDVDFAGLDFDKNSPRYAADKIAAEDLKNADFDLKIVGNFTNPEMIDVLDAIDNYGLDVVQLNGNETPEMCEDLSDEVEVIKAFTLTDKITDIDALVLPYDVVCDFYLFTTSNKNAFDWNILKKAKIEKPFFISGGIGLPEVAKAKNFKHIDFFAIDVNEAFEKEIGIKDMALLLQLRQAMKG